MTDPAPRMPPPISLACELLEQNPTSEWTLDKLVAESGMPKSTFLMQFRRLVGKSPIQFLRDQRMKVACKLLEDRHMSIAAIAKQVGYDSVSAFGATFKRWAGCSPSKFRREKLKVVRLKFPSRYAN